MVTDGLSLPEHAHNVDAAVEHGAGVSKEDRIRIALGVTSKQADLTPLMHAIHDVDGAVRDIVLISPKGSPVPGPCGCPGQDASVSFLTFDGETIVDRDVPAVETLQTARLRTQLKDFANWMAPALASRLRRHLQTDAVVTAVALYSSEEEQDVCRILLDCAVDYIYVQDAPT